MKFCVLLITLAFAAKKNTESVAKMIEQDRAGACNPILVKIEEDEYAKVKEKTSKYFGVSYKEERKKWEVTRRSKNEKKSIHNGSYNDEEAAAHASDTLARNLMKNGEHGHKLNFPDDSTEVYPEETNITSTYIGVSYDENRAKWRTQRRSKHENTMVSNGYYKDEKIAAHASDNLARKLMANGERNLKLNFPDDHTEVYREEKINTSKYIGVSHHKKVEKWIAIRWSKKESKSVHNGSYKDEETAAHASDTLARKLMANGEQNHKLNFPNDDAEVNPEKTNTSRYIGVSYNENISKWRTQRRSRKENTIVYNGFYKDKETAAHASDTLARKLMANGEHHHKLNFPDDYTDVYAEKFRRNKRKRPEELGASQTDESFFAKFE